MIKQKIPPGTKTIVITGTVAEDTFKLSLGECNGFEATGYTPSTEVIDRVRLDTSSPTPFDVGEITYYDEHGNVIVHYKGEGEV